MVRRHGHDHTRKGLEGSLSDVSVRKLLDACRAHRVTGALRIISWGRPGIIQMRAGQVEQAFFGALRDHEAVNELVSLRDGLFDVLQELPDLSQAPSPSPGRTLLSALLQQCRDRALSCDIILIRDRERAELCCRAGTIVHTSINGVRHPGAPRELRRFEHACARVDPVPLSPHGDASTDRASIEPGSARSLQPRARRSPAVVLQPETAQPAIMPLSMATPAATPAATRPRPAPARPPAAPAQALATAATQPLAAAAQALATAATQPLAAAARAAGIQPAVSSHRSVQVPRPPQIARSVVRLATGTSWYNTHSSTELVVGGRGYSGPHVRDRTATILLALAVLMLVLASLIASGW